ncbi:hypothetical protein L3X38_009282 [Prunus dulcis]|uniref:Protein kinase domain-containing protein n=1 Tax=Prunus dulcis TaxID=3755 RepID=A0AAD5F7P3_PRUDU|nr:hypothetical protein L3X38_009282 [Prunus dulcis]
MGCICSKATLSNQYVSENQRRDKELKSSKSSKLSEAAVGADATARLITNPHTEENAGSTPISSDEGEKKMVVTEKPTKPFMEGGASVGKSPSGLTRITSVSNGERGAQVVAGWPSWLTAVAGEAISGWVPLKADSFEKLEKIGQGTYSSVYRARDLDSNKIVALKKVRFANMDPETYTLYLNTWSMILLGLQARPGVKFTEAQIKCYMQQLLRGLEHCHSHDYGVAVDLWSAGCILAELFAGKPIMPGRTEVEQLHKIFKLCGSPSEEYWKRSKLPHATIFKPTHPYKRCVAETFKDFPPSALALLEVLLAVEPESRGTASSALHSEFFTSLPLPSDPSSLPKYPPSKEFDAKLRDEEARRRRAPGSKGGSSKELKAVPAPDANAIQRQGQPNPKSISEKYNPDEDSGSGFPIEPPKGATSNGYSHSGQSMHPSAFGSLRNMSQSGQSRNGAEKSYMYRGAAQSSRFSNSASVRSDSRYDGVVEASANPHWPEERINARYSHLDNGDSSAKHDWSHNFLDRPKSSHKKDEQPSGKESSTGYATKKNRIHYSGPLMPPGGNLEEMLKEHERQIQHAVRKARLDKNKPKKANSENGQTESLLHHIRNGR